MSQAAKAQEPSMEEILASIRRIIADDEAAKPEPKAPESPQAAPAPAAEPAAMSQDDIDAMLAGFDAPAAEPERSPPADGPADVLELTAAMEAPSEAAPAPAFRTIEASSDVVFADAEPEPVTTWPREVEAMHARTDEVEERPLLSNRATEAVTAAFGTLAHTVLTQNARTLDDLVQEMLRPMLKSWLDDNLPTIVERLVRAEIERVSRGRG